MDVGFDKAGRGETAAEIDDLALGCKPRLDRRNPAAGDADVGQLLLGAYSARVPQNEIHRPLACYPFITTTAHGRRDTPSPAPGPARLRARFPNV